MKTSFEEDKSNSGMLIGNDDRINFWFYKWNGLNVIETLNTIDGTLPFLKDRAATYIHNCQWSLPRKIQVEFPNLADFLSNFHLSIDDKADLLV